MRLQRLSEDDAFTLLRTASMPANLRVGEVPCGVIEAAQAADAVNRAGQLRMLSQRYGKALALPAMPRLRSDDHAAETVMRLQANLDHLATLPPGGPLAALLARADALTGAPETASGRRNLRLVDLWGRQRMPSQRLAKQALLAGLLPDAAAGRRAAAAAQTAREFKTTLAAQEQASPATEAIGAALAQARGHWQRLLDGLRRAAGNAAAAGRAALARESEALLASFEQLTSLRARHAGVAGLKSPAILQFSGLLPGLRPILPWV